MGPRADKQFRLRSCLKAVRNGPCELQEVGKCELGCVWTQTCGRGQQAAGLTPNPIAVVSHQGMMTGFILFPQPRSPVHLPCTFLLSRYKVCWSFQGVSIQVWQRRCHMFFISMTPLWCLLSPKSLLRFIPVIVAVIFPSTCALYLERAITTLHIQQML